MNTFVYAIACGASLSAIIQWLWIERLTADLDGVITRLKALEVRLRVVEQMLGAKWLLPDAPRDLEAGVERLHVVRATNTED